MLISLTRLLLGEVDSLLDNTSCLVTPTVKNVTENLLSAQNALAQQSWTESLIPVDHHAEWDSGKTQQTADVLPALATSSNATQLTDLPSTEKTPDATNPAKAAKTNMNVSLANSMPQVKTQCSSK